MRSTLLLLTLLLNSLPMLGQDTFSIVAIDTVTGEVGAAGASCVAFNPLGPFINRLLPGQGAITCQSYVSTLNRDSAASWMANGVSAPDIIDSLYNNDSQNDPEIRQNLAIDFQSGAAYTGTNCLAWAGHRVTATYVVAGNILSGPDILDSLELGFNSTTGTLADKLMGALQKANVVGADSRCGQYGTSSLSAFLRVAAPTDQAGAIALDLNTAFSPQAPADPIAALSTEYQNWLATSRNLPRYSSIEVYPNPGDRLLALKDSRPIFDGDRPVRVYDLNGKLVRSALWPEQESNFQVETASLPAGMYAVQVGSQVFKWLKR